MTPVRPEMRAFDKSILQKYCLAAMMPTASQFLAWHGINFRQLTAAENSPIRASIEANCRIPVSKDDELTP